jgi:hypothetical protein
MIPNQTLKACKGVRGSSECINLALIKAHCPFIDIASAFLIYNSGWWLKSPAAHSHRTVSFLSSEFSCNVILSTNLKAGFLSDIRVGQMPILCHFRMSSVSLFSNPKTKTHLYVSRPLLSLSLYSVAFLSKVFRLAANFFTAVATFIQQEP